MKICEIGSVTESKKIQRLDRPSILCNSRPFLQSLETFFKGISNNAGEAVFVKWKYGSYRPYFVSKLGNG